MGLQAALKAGERPGYKTGNQSSVPHYLCAQRQINPRSLMCETEGTPTSLHRDVAAADDVGKGTLQIVTLR